MKTRYTAIVLVLFALAACQAPAGDENGQDPNDYYTMDVQQLHDELESKDFLFVNVHIPFEGDIAGTDLSIPYNEITLTDNLAQLPADRDARIVLYCRSGRMSAIAAGDLAAAGYTNVWDVIGGMVAWENAGYEILR